MYEITLGKHFIFLSFHFLCLFSNDPGKGQFYVLYIHFNEIKLTFAICCFMQCHTSYLEEQTE